MRGKRYLFKLPFHCNELNDDVAGCSNSIELSLRRTLVLYQFYSAFALVVCVIPSIFAALAKNSAGEVDEWLKSTVC